MKKITKHICRIKKWMNISCAVSGSFITMHNSCEQGYGSEFLQFKNFCGHIIIFKSIKCFLVPATAIVTSQFLTLWITFVVYFVAYVYKKSKVFSINEWMCLETLILQTLSCVFHKFCLLVIFSYTMLSRYNKHLLCTYSICVINASLLYL